jgi:hypothetical protein
MPTNKKPMLSILVDGEKRDNFSALCTAHGRSMSWAINAFIDQCLELETINPAPSSLSEDVHPEGIAQLLEKTIHLAENLAKVELAVIQLPIDLAERLQPIFHNPESSKPIVVAEDEVENSPEDMEKQRIIEEMARRGLWKVQKS